MGNLFESLKDYFENTPNDVIENDWREIEYLNEIGPDVIEYAEFVREYFGTAVSYSNTKEKEETHRYVCKPDKIQICFFDKTLLTEPYRIVGKKAFTANQTI